MAGQVRAVLWKHLASREARDDPSGADPTAFLPVHGFATALSNQKRRHGAESLRDAGRDYARLWARTFPVLVQHLRGRPERSMALFCDEVYPYLRGQARAARLEGVEPGRARLLLASDLDPDYMCGLLEGFVGLSGAEGVARPTGPERFEVRFRIHPSDRFARAVQTISGLRIPLLATAVAAAILGLRLSAGGEWLAVGAVLLGTLGAQLAANGLHDRRFPRLRGTLDVEDTRLGPRVRMLSGYAVAVAATAFLVWQGRTGVLAFAALGAILSLSYPLVRDQGLGPILAGAIHGPLIVLGSMYAVTGSVPLTWPPVVASMAPGALVAAMLFVDDLADRPLDVAGGKRTMAVRLPNAMHAIGFQTLLVIALAGAASAAWLTTGPRVAGALAVAFLAFPILLGRMVARNLDDPRRLAPARAGTLAYHLALTTALTLVL